MNRLQSERQEFFSQYNSEARAILDEILEKYAEHGTTQFAFPEILKVPPISRHGNIFEIAAYFGGPEKLNQAFSELQSNLYSA
jgi:type I restriction enzyme R subunit